MAIYTERVVMVNKDTAKMDNDIYIYKGNRNICIQFKIIDSQFKFRDVNLVDKFSPSHGYVTLINPEGEQIATGKAEIENATLKLTVTSGMIDEDTEVGDYTIVIDLYDEVGDSLLTIPPIYNQLHVLKRVTDVQDIPDEVRFVYEDDGNLQTVNIDAYVEGAEIKTINKMPLADTAAREDIEAIKTAYSGVSNDFDQLEKNVNSTTAELNARIDLDMDDLADYKEEVNAQIKDITNEKILFETHKPTDDSSLIQAKIDKLAQKNGGVFVFDGGVYTLNNINIPSGVSIRGSQGTIIKSSINTGSVGAFIFKLNSNTSLSDLAFIFDDDKLNNAIVVGNYPTGDVTENVYINKVSIKNARRGILLGATKNIHISDCTIVGTDTSTHLSGIQLYTDTSSSNINISINNNNIQSVETGIHAVGTGNRTRIMINNNTIHDCKTALNLYHGDYSIINSNNITRCENGIMSDGHSSITSNSVTYASDTAIYAEELQEGQVISSNSISNSGKGIVLGASFKNSKVSSNIIIKCVNGIVVSNEFVPSLMISYFNVDVTIDSNRIGYCNLEGIKVLGIRGYVTISNNEVNDCGIDETSDSCFAIYVGNDANGSKQNTQIINLVNNYIHCYGRKDLNGNIQSCQSGAYLYAATQINIIGNMFYNPRGKKTINDDSTITYSPFELQTKGFSSTECVIMNNCFNTKDNSAFVLYGSISYKIMSNYGAQPDNLNGNILTGTSAPTKKAQFIGQEYIDTTNKNVYKAISVNTGSDDWIKIN